MKVAVAVWALAALSTMTARAEQQAMNSPATTPSLFPLFITGDLKGEFLTQHVDARTMMWLETPVSIEGSRALQEATQQSEGKIVLACAELHREPGSNESIEYGRSAWVWVVVNSLDASLAKTTHVLLLN